MSKPEINSLLDSSFVFVPLDINDPTAIPQEDQFYIAPSSFLVRTEGMRNAQLEIQRFQKNQQPYWVALDPQGLTISESSDLLSEELVKSFLIEVIRRMD